MAKLSPSRALAALTVAGALTVGVATPAGAQVPGVSAGCSAQIDDSSTPWAKEATAWRSTCSWGEYGQVLHDMALFNWVRFCAVENQYLTDLENHWYQHGSREAYAAAVRWWVVNYRVRFVPVGLLRARCP